MLKKEIFIFLVIMISLISISPILNSDVISINSGGSGETAVTTDKYVEGFFSRNAICGDGLVDSGEQCDDGNTADGDGCSSTCQDEVADTGEAPSGGGGTTYPSEENIKVSPEEFNVNIKVNTNVKRTLKITNLDSSQIDIEISQSGLDNKIIIKNDSLTLSGGETKEFDIIFVAPNETGIYMGEILVNGKSIPVSLNVKTELLLFDSNIIVLNPNYQVPQGDELRTEVVLIPMGEELRLDVTLDYEIRDYNGTVYLTRSETLLVEEQMDFRRDFDTGNLPKGEYIVGLELIYPNGVAPSSAHFEIIEKPATDIFAKIVLYMIVLILIISILIVIILIRKYMKKRKANISS